MLVLLGRSLAFARTKLRTATDIQIQKTPQQKKSNDENKRGAETEFE
jgi:hypothetical protein